MGLLARPGHRACRRWRARRTRLNRQADVFPVALAGLGIFQTSPPAGVRIASGTGAHYLQYSGLPNFKVANGFIQSLVGLYDFANLTGRPHRAVALRGRRPRRPRRDRHVRHRRLEPLQPRRAGHARVRPRLPHAAARLPQAAVLAHDRGRVLRGRAALHRVPHHAAGRCESLTSTLTARKQREHPLQALEDLARHADDHARRQAGRHARARRARPRDQVRRLDRAQEVRRLRRQRSAPPTSPTTPPPRPGVITVKKRG